MSKIDMIYGFGDILDRLFVIFHKISIKKIRKESFNKEEKDAKVIKEYIAEKYSKDLAIHIEKLFEANHEIWELESDLRKKNNISDEEAGRRSKKIREINDKKRIYHRNMINELTSTGITEKKVI